MIDNKSGVLDKFFESLQVDTFADNSSVQPDHESVQFIRDLQGKSRENYNHAVPPEWKTEILKSGLTEGIDSDLIPENSHSDSLLKTLSGKSGGVWGINLNRISYLTAAVLLVVLGYFVSLQMKSTQTETFTGNHLISELQQKGEITVSTGELLHGKGLHIKALIGGSIAMVHENGKTTYSFNQGEWKVNTKHEDLADETWFRFPGGRLTPIGTGFTIKIGNGQTEIILTEGTIGVIAQGSNGNKGEVQQFDAPYKGTFQFRSVKSDRSGKNIEDGISSDSGADDVSGKTDQQEKADDNNGFEQLKQDEEFHGNSRDDWDSDLLFDDDRAEIDTEEEEEI